MTSTTTHCDRCGKPITDARTLLAAKVECGPLLALGLDQVDLCQGCATALAEWLKTPSAGEGPCADS